MSKEHNLIVAKRGLALPENFNLDMWRYSSNLNMPEVNECGTSFCFAGYLAAEDKYPKKFVSDRTGFDYTRYSENLVNGNKDAWTFFFGSLWPSTFKDLKERCQYIIDNDGELPINFKQSENTWESK